MAHLSAQPGPEGVHSKQWLCFFVSTAYLFRPEAIQEQIKGLDPISGLPAVELVLRPNANIYKITLPIVNYDDISTNVGHTLARITAMEERTATWVANNEPADWVEVTTKDGEHWSTVVKQVVDDAEQAKARDEINALTACQARIVLCATSEGKTLRQAIDLAKTCGQL